MAPSDVGVVAECHTRAWQMAFRGILTDGLLDALTIAEVEESWRALVSKPGRLNLVAEGPDGVVGFVALEAIPVVAGAAGEVIGIYVHPDHWRAGAGRLLLTAALSHMAAAGFAGAFLWTMADNQLSRAFYEGLGLSFCGEMRESERLGETFSEVKYICELPLEA